MKTNALLFYVMVFIFMCVYIITGIENIMGGMIVSVFGIAVIIQKIDEKDK